MESNDQLVVFEINKQKYALPIYNVSEIIHLMEVTKIPSMQNYYKGIVNLRGLIIPVMSLSSRLGFKESELEKDARIIVTEIGEKKIGLIVDGVSSVTRYSEDEFDAPESLEAESQFIKGIIRQENDMLLLLDLPSILN